MTSFTTRTCRLFDDSPLPHPSLPLLPSHQLAASRHLVNYALESFHRFSLWFCLECRDPPPASVFIQLTFLNTPPAVCPGALGWREMHTRALLSELPSLV